MYFFERLVIPASGISNPGGGLTNVGSLVDGNTTTVGTLTQPAVTIQIDLGAAKSVGLPALA